MLQSIQYIGSGPPTYVYSKNAVGTSGEFYHVFAAETRGYDERQERRRERSAEKHRKNAENYEIAEDAEYRGVDNKNTDIQEMYKKEYGRRESFLWKQK